MPDSGLRDHKLTASSICGLPRAPLKRSTDSHHLWSSWTFSFTQTPTLLKLSKPPSNVLRRGRINVESPSKSTLHRDNRICFRELKNAERLLLRTRHSEGKQTTERCRGNDATTAPPVTAIRNLENSSFKWSLTHSMTMLENWSNTSWNRFILFE